jgi:hypothetical protein
MRLDLARDGRRWGPVIAVKLMVELRVARPACSAIYSQKQTCVQTKRTRRH